MKSNFNISFQIIDILNNLTGWLESLTATFYSTKTISEEITKVPIAYIGRITISVDTYDHSNL